MYEDTRGLTRPPNAAEIVARYERETWDAPDTEISDPDPEEYEKSQRSKRRDEKLERLKLIGEAPHGEQLFSATKECGPIPPRQWLLGVALCRKFLSMLVATGGTGKTALEMARAVALATGKPITGEHVHRKCNVLYLSLEDDREEIERRLTACLIGHGIRRAELGERLWIFTNPESDDKLAVIVEREVFVGRLFRRLEEIIVEHEIDAIFVDPFIKSHSVNENDNGQIDFVAGLLAKLAHQYNIAVEIAHHVAKGMDDPGNADRARGASAAKDAARIATTLTRMNSDDAKLLGIDAWEAWRYVRIDSAKVNITRPAKGATWFRLESVELGNGNDEYPNGDHVQTIRPWTPLDVAALLDNDRDLRDTILHEMAQADKRDLVSTSANSKSFVGKLFKRHIPEVSTRTALEQVTRWVDEGLIEIVEFSGYNGAIRKGGIQVKREALRALS